jgi:hypothetical protein
MYRYFICSQLSDDKKQSDSKKGNNVHEEKNLQICRLELREVYYVAAAKEEKKPIIVPYVNRHF